MLISVADSGGGRYAFVNIVAEDARVVLTPASGVDIAGVLGQPKTSFGADGLRVHLPDVIDGDELNLVIELDVTAPRVRCPRRTSSSR